MMPNPEPIIQWAIEIAEGLPEKYQVVAFAELLQHALRSTSHGAESDEQETPPTATPQPPGQLLQERLVSQLPEDYLVAAKGTRDQQTVLVAIRLWHQGEEVNPASVMDSVKTQLCVPPESRSNTSARLRDLSPRYLTRRQREEGRGYAYEPTLKAIEIFEGLEE
jgi:hypothetical protein